ncbi:hypothetical protein NL64_25820 [Pseudomonas fluorescens]|jgi:hypothetical protein|uniref:hypothetical protein n=2 Tax=Pseudomonas TaxID=286 RepID=UPI00054BF9F3|nr:hypothetical protein [Pseudomonas fluorescens]KII27902.1 hypothetical protein NL64_25820 [Pseudomonas fluorescens]
MKEDKKQQALNELSQRLAQSFQQITQPFLPLGKLIGHIGASLYADYQECLDAERKLENLPMDEYKMIPQLLEQKREQRKSGGRVTGEQRKQKKEVDHAEVIKMFHTLKTKMSERGIAAKIAELTKLHPTTVRRILREAGLK